MMYLWIAIAVVCIAVDLFTSAFLFVWISLGAFAALAAYMFNMSVAVQIITFCIVSIIAIAVGYPWAKKKMKSIKKTPLMEETYIGKEFTAEEDIEDECRLKVSGIYWTGENTGEKILKGDKFKITGIDGNKLKIEKI